MKVLKQNDSIIFELGDVVPNSNDDRTLLELQEREGLRKGTLGYYVAKEPLNCVLLFNDERDLIPSKSLEDYPDGYLAGYNWDTMAGLFSSKNWPTKGFELGANSKMMFIRTSNAIELLFDVLPGVVNIPKSDLFIKGNIVLNYDVELFLKRAKSLNGDVAKLERLLTNNPPIREFEVIDY